MSTAPHTTRPSPAVMTGTEDFAGTWRLVAFETRVSDGRVIPQFGDDAEGMITYTPDGRVWVFVAAAGRPHFASPNMWRGSPQEYTEAMRTYIHYSATVEVDRESREVIHHVDGSLFPNWKGDVLRRFYEFSDDGNRLELTTPPVPAGKATAIGVLAWERVSSYRHMAG